MNDSLTVTLTTDYGIKDEYAAALKAAILYYSDRIKIVDITHGVTPFSILEGAFLLSCAVPNFKKAVHLAVVDPGVGSQRRLLVLKTFYGHFLVGPDNGLLIPAAERLGGISSAYEIVPERFIRREISSTFHGRDIMAPAAALLALGISPEEISDPVEPESLFPSPFNSRFSKNTLETQVANIDNFGSLRFPVFFSELVERFGGTKKLAIESKGRSFLLGCEDYFAKVKKGELFYYKDSSGYLAISANLDRADKILHLKLEDRLTMQIVEEK